MLLLRRRYSDSYLAEIGEPGTNGALVRRRGGVLEPGLLCRDYFGVDGITFTVTPAISGVPTLTGTSTGDAYDGSASFSWATKPVWCSVSPAELVLDRSGASNILGYKGGDCSMPTRFALWPRYGSRTVWAASGYDQDTDSLVTERDFSVSFTVGDLYSPYWGQMSGSWRDLPADIISHEHYADCVPEGKWAMPFRAVAYASAKVDLGWYPTNTNPSGNPMATNGVAYVEWTVVNEGYFIFTASPHRLVRDRSGSRRRAFTMSRAPGMPEATFTADPEFGVVSAGDQENQEAVARNMYYDSFAPARFTTRSGDFHFAGRA